MALIQAKQLSYSYRTGAPVVAELDCNIHAGEVVALMGPSGGGKSTLLYLFGLLLTPSAGLLRFHGQETTDLDDARRSQLRARHVGFLFQDALLDPRRTVMANIVEGLVYSAARDSPKDAQAAVLPLLEQVGLGARDLLTRPPAEISGGQGQRVALCRALLKQPSLVLADEPTGNLDHRTSDLVIDLLRTTAEGGTAVVIATHDERLAAQVDRVIEVGEA